MVGLTLMVAKRETCFHQYWSEIYRGTDRMTKKHNTKRMAKPLDNKVGAAVMQYWSNKNLIKVTCVFLMII